MASSQPSDSLKRPREPDPGAGPAGSGPEVPTETASKSAAPPEGAGKIDRALKDAALNYLEEVKRKFKHDEKVYNSFLDIMKDFQSRRIKTEGVIDRVSQLFKGDRALILGFNTFLPDGYKIPESYADAQVAAHAKLASQNRARQMQAVNPPVAMGKPRKAMSMPNRGAAGGLPSTKGPELEYAKRYVQKIKKRFENSEEVYNRFLNILQSYQEECKSVKTVYEEVRELFADHRDLLAEFAQFLPAPEAQAQEANAVLMGGPTTSTAGKPAKRQRKRDDAVDGSGGPSGAVKYKEELELMRTLRDNMSLRQWEDLLKVFNLFSQQILTPSEMMEALQQLNVKHPEMHDSLQQFLTLFCGSAALLNGTAPSAARAGAAPTNSLGELGPNYRMCTNDRGEPTTAITTCASDDPASALNRSCLLRSSAHRMLNHVRKDTGRPGRKEWSNSAENVLWDIEEQQLQIDLLVHRAARAAEVLKPLAEETAILTVEQQKSLDLQPLEHTISIVEVVYGAKADAMIEAMYSAPADTIPVVLARIQQKEEQWRGIRKDLQPKFAAEYAKHHEEALDHQPHQYQIRQLQQMELPVLVQAVIAAGATGLELQYSEPNQDAMLYRLLDAGVEDSQRPQWQLFCQGWLRRFLGSPQVSGLIFVPGLTVGILQLHHQIHECLHKICSIVREDHPADQQAALLEKLISTMIGTIRRQNSMMELEKACRACAGSKFYLFCTLPALVQSLLTHALKLVKCPQWQRVCNIWDSCNSCTSWSISTLTPEQYREMMPSLLGPDCYQVAVTAQRQVTIALCKPNQDKNLAPPLQPASLSQPATATFQPAAAPSAPAASAAMPAAASSAALSGGGPQALPSLTKQEQLPTLSNRLNTQLLNTLPTLSGTVKAPVSPGAPQQILIPVKPEPVQSEPSSVRAPASNPANSQPAVGQHSQSPPTVAPAETGMQNGGSVQPASTPMAQVAAASISPPAPVAPANGTESPAAPAVEPSIAAAPAAPNN